ncbi:hypothetical protein [Neobacillus muris]|uniref:hypothetical protein n=1 Tax=Neobacillus muris TaxID=2941334 RepID=UPI00203EE87C|nr:hypothetical protein [Neobacillus muris]
MNVMIDNGLIMIELEAEAYGQRSILHPVLIWDDTAAVLIDTGMPKSRSNKSSGKEGPVISFI